MRTVAFCEIDPFARKVLANKWPSVPVYRDIKALTAERMWTDGVDTDSIGVICGGFPCQDISEAKQGAVGIDGQQSGLVDHLLRLTDEIRPGYVILENSHRLRHLGLDRILRRLDALGYDAEWHVLRAADVGAPHRRRRIYIVAYPHGQPAIWPSISWQECAPWPCEPSVPRVANGVPNQPHKRRVLGNAVVPQIPEIIGRAIMKAANADVR